MYVCVQGETYYVCDDYVYGERHSMSVMTESAGRDIVCMSVFGDRHSMYVCGERNSMSMRLCLRGGHSMSVYVCVRGQT